MKRKLHGFRDEKHLDVTQNPMDGWMKNPWMNVEPDGWTDESTWM